MAAETITSDKFPKGTSRYTLAIAKCLGSLSPGLQGLPNRNVVQALINLVQGRMLEYLADRICREYDIQDPILRQRIVTVLLVIFTDEFFALFRSKIDPEPALVLDIARRILRKELDPSPAKKYTARLRQPADRLYPALFRKYFEYRDLGMLLELVESDAQIQRIILSNVLKRRLDQDPVREEILQILEEDRDGIAANLLMGYLKGEDTSVLVDKVQSGVWRQELGDLKQRMAHLRGQ